MKRIICTVVVLACLGLVSQAKATIVSFDLDQEFSGATPPATLDPPGPWFEAQFSDESCGTDCVDLKLEAHLTDKEFVRIFMFNFDDNQIWSTPLEITADSANPSVSTVTQRPAADQTAAGFKADGDGYYDIRIDFGANEFTDGLEYFFLIKGSGITASDFEFLSFPKVGESNGIYYAAAHVQGIGPDDNDSGWIGPSEGFTPVPEPATMFLLGTGLVGVAGVARRKIRKNQA